MAIGQIRRLATVRLQDSSRNEGRAVRTEAWSVRVGDTWKPLRDWQAFAPLLERLAITVDEDEFQDRPPGCRSLRSYVVTLPVGSRLHRHLSMPRPERRRAACSTIGEATQVGDVARWVIANHPPAQTPLAQQNVEYRVTRSGRLVTEEHWQAARGRRSAPPRARELETARADEAPLDPSPALTVVASKAG